MLTCFSCDVIDGTLARVCLSGRSCGVNEQSDRQGGKALTKRDKYVLWGEGGEKDEKKGE